jgi:hypothetical protein
VRLGNAIALAYRTRFAAIQAFSVPFYVVGLFGLLFGQGSSWCYGAALKTNATSFPSESRGSIMGLLVALYGLCSGFFAQIYVAFFTSPLQFLFVMGIVLPCTTFIMSFFIRAVCACAHICARVLIVAQNPVTDLSRREQIRIKIAFAVTVVITAIIAASSLLNTYVHYKWTGYVVAGSLVLFFASSGGSSDMPYEDNAQFSSVNFTLWMAMRTIDYWLIFFVFFALIGFAFRLSLR